MIEHLDLDELADLLAGADTDRDPETEAAEQEHLAGCAHCRGRLAELETALPAVTASLAELPLPAEPADLAARLDAALAAEAPMAEAPTATVIPLASPSRNRSSTRWLSALSAVAAAAVVVTGGVLVVRSGSPAGDADTAATVPYTTNATGTNYDQASLAAAVPALLAGTATPATGLAAEGAGGSVGGTPSTLQRATPGKATQDNALSPTAVDPLAPLREPARLASCLSALLDPGSDELPLALDYAAYQGKPALIVVLPGGKADKVDVFVVGAGCAQPDADLLFFTRLARP